jgi:hypothetical protein
MYTVATKVSSNRATFYDNISTKGADEPDRFIPSRVLTQAEIARLTPGQLVGYKRWLLMTGPPLREEDIARLDPIEQRAYRRRTHMMGPP